MRYYARDPISLPASILSKSPDAMDIALLRRDIYQLVKSGDASMSVPLRHASFWVVEAMAHRSGHPYRSMTTLAIDIVYFEPGAPQTVYHARTLPILLNQCPHGNLRVDPDASRALSYRSNLGDFRLGVPVYNLSLMGAVTRYLNGTGKSVCPCFADYDTYAGHLLRIPTLAEIVHRRPYAIPPLLRARRYGVRDSWAYILAQVDVLAGVGTSRISQAAATYIEKQKRTILRHVIQTYPRAGKTARKMGRELLFALTDTPADINQAVRAALVVARLIDTTEGGKFARLLGARPASARSAFVQINIETTTMPAPAGPEITWKVQQMTNWNSATTSTNTANLNAPRPAQAAPPQPAPPQPAPAAPPVMGLRKRKFRGAGPLDPTRAAEVQRLMAGIPDSTTRKVT